MNQIYNDVRDNFDRLDLSVSQDETSLKSKKLLTLLSFMFASITILSINNNKIINMYDNKLSTIDKILNNIVNDIKLRLKRYGRIHYADSQIIAVVKTAYNKLINFIPYVNLYEMDINTIRLERMKKELWYMYIYTLNSLYFGKNLNMEYVLKTSFTDLKINYNNIFIPTLPFLKKGGLDIIPILKNINDFDDEIKKTFINFIHNGLIYEIFKDNPNYKELHINLKPYKQLLIKRLIYYTNLYNEKLNTVNSRRINFYSTENYKNLNINKIDSTKYIDDDKTHINLDHISSKNIEEQISKINDLLNTKFNIINLNDILSIISYDLKYLKFNHSYIINTEEDYTTYIEISKKIKALENSNYDYKKIIINNDLYSTLRNIKANNTLSKYYDIIIQYIKNSSENIREKKIVKEDYDIEKDDVIDIDADEQVKEVDLFDEVNENEPDDYDDVGFDLDEEIYDQDQDDFENPLHDGEGD